MSVLFNLLVKLVATSDVLALSAKLVLTSTVFAFVFILLEKREVSEAVTDIKSNAACVFILIGLSASAVLFILSSANDVLKAVIDDTPVPPLFTGTIPAIFSASTLLANCAYATYWNCVVPMVV